MKKGNSILDFMQAFPDEDSCIMYLERIRWGDKVVSPFDPESTVYKCSGHKYRCRNTGKYFNVKTGTFLEGTKLSMDKWFYAIMLLASHKRGISSCQLAKDISVTQKTAWRMLHLIRTSMSFENGGFLSNNVEIDETFVGGKNKNRHRDKKVEHSQGRSFKDKVPVFGMYQRGGNIIARTVENTQANTLLPYIRKHIVEGSTVFTDGWEYGELKETHHQMSVDHGRGFYGAMVITPDGELLCVTTNGIECAWSHFKRTITGIYYHVSKKHLQRYVDEFVFRYNTRKCSNYERFELLLRSA